LIGLNRAPLPFAVLLLLHSGIAMTATFTGSESENWHWDCDSVGRLEKKRAKKNNTKEARKKKQEVS